MADTVVKAVIQVTANADGARVEMKKLSDVIDDMGKKSEKAGTSLGGLVKGTFEGLGKFNQAFEGLEKIYNGLNKAMDIALGEQRRANMEKLLPTGAVDRFREATDKMIGRNEVLRLSVKGMTGDFKITNDQMETVLKTSIALSQKTGEQADVIADKLLDALAKGVQKLDDFGINLEKTGNHQTDVNNAMEKFRDIIAENPIDEQTKSLMQMKDALRELAAAFSEVVAAMARGAASAYNYSREGVNYISDWLGRLGDDGFGAGDTAIDRMNKRQANRAGLWGYQAGGGLVDAARGYVAEGRRRDQRPYWAQMSEQEYAAQVAGIELDPDMPWGDTPMGRFSQNQKLGRNRMAPGSYTQRGVFDAGERTVYGMDNVASLGFVAAGSSAGTLGVQDRLRGNIVPGSIYDRTEGGYAGGTYDAGPGFRRYYDPRNPLGAMSAGLQDQAYDGTGTFGDVMGSGAFDTAAQGAMAGIEAMVNGQKSIGKAVAAASQAALKAKAIEWGAFALGELAWAIASPATSAQHLAAAAKFGAAAAAAGLGAAALGALAGGGGGGGSVGSAGGGYASPVGGRTGGGGGSETIVVNIGDGFYGDSAAVAEAVANGVRAGKRKGARDNYSASYSG